ncbi:MAG: GrpE protein [Candidatus Parvarchaeum acidiphilum ARMAN-4_'5-way FS']|jgi:molecular chaperone GrpE|uniref:GrpE protein n=1 Tax=Candidatus Parvarchaeum acidiphilum ARMAN-4_'5-way FS' TaxID=994837 RepID=F2UTU4_PARA4|nr:MAG: GrpE protein [Candidatus Parvarchaeum acidiphilum ARMAN-4_'5-way FS']
MEDNSNAAQDLNVENKEEQNDEDYKNKYLYLLAEVDNYKKSKEKELVEYIKYSNEKLISDMLKVLDDFDSVLKQDKDEKIIALRKAFVSVLSYYGLEEMEVVGKEFSSDIAEAVATEENEKEKGKIIEEVQKGYKLNGKIIRYPKVKISI